MTSYSLDNTHAHDLDTTKTVFSTHTLALFNFGSSCMVIAAGSMSLRS